jgi:hypothetical protein
VHVDGGATGAFDGERDPWAEERDSAADLARAWISANAGSPRGGDLMD